MYLFSIRSNLYGCAVCTHNQFTDTRARELSLLHLHMRYTKWKKKHDLIYIFICVCFTSSQFYVAYYRYRYRHIDSGNRSTSIISIVFKFLWEHAIYANRSYVSEFQFYFFRALAWYGLDVGHIVRGRKKVTKQNGIEADRSQATGLHDTHARTKKKCARVFCRSQAKNEWKDGYEVIAFLTLIPMKSNVFEHLAEHEQSACDTINVRML